MITAIFALLILLSPPPICPGDLEPCVSDNPPSIAHPVYLPVVVTP